MLALVGIGGRRNLQGVRASANYLDSLQSANISVQTDCGGAAGICAEVING